MPELRWALVVLGALCVAGLALWEWRRSRRRHAGPESVGVTPAVVAHAGGESRHRRIEPHIDSLLPSTGAPAGDPQEPLATLIDDVPVVHPAEQLEVPVARENAVDVPAAVKPAARAARAPVRWPPERADRVLTLRLVNAQGALLPGREARLALEQAGLAFGPQRIYHLADAQGAVLVSAANLLRPGDLDPAHMDEQQLRGLSLFSVLPGPLPPVRMLEELVAVARAVAWRLGAVVQDDQGAELDGERLVRLRQSLPQATEDGAG